MNVLRLFTIRKEKPRMSMPCTGNITVLRQALYLFEDFL